MTPLFRTTSELPNESASPGATPGKITLDLAVAVALGGNAACGDVALLRAQPSLGVRGGGLGCGRYYG
jgi:hypothetical protein